MNVVHELIEAPLSRDELAVRYRALCDDPCYASVPGKIELDVWALMSKHGLLERSRFDVDLSRLFD
jgi:hypothetical protein